MDTGPLRIESDACTLRIALGPPVEPWPPAREGSSSRVAAGPSPEEQALELLDSIDKTRAWAEQPVAWAERKIAALQRRASAAGVSPRQLRALVAGALAEGSIAEVAIELPETAQRLARDLRGVGEALRDARCRARAASKQVIQLSLRAPAVTRTARLRLHAAPPEERPLTLAWLEGFAARAKRRADEARISVGGLPARADALRTRLRRLLDALSGGEDEPTEPHAIVRDPARAPAATQAQADGARPRPEAPVPA